jgi:hypothetical protein
MRGFNLPPGCRYDCEPGYDEDQARWEWEEDWADRCGSTIEECDAWCDDHPEEAHA